MPNTRNTLQDRDYAELRDYFDKVETDLLDAASDDEATIDFATYWRVRLEHLIAEREEHRQGPDWLRKELAL